MIETTDEWTKNVKRNERIDLSFEVTKIVMKVIAKILFGTDVDNIPQIPYSNPKTGQTTNLSLEEFYFQYTRNEFDGYSDPKGSLLPFLSQYGLIIEPYKSNYKNNRVFAESIRNFMTKTKDTESIYKRLEALGKFTDDAILYDMIMLLFAGFDTLSHLIASSLYQLKKPKNSDSLDKLMKAFRESGISDIDASKANNLKDVYENCDYLNYVMKEVFRIDGPAIGGLNYYAKEDITLCGIPFNKGFILYPSVIYPHYNPKEWHDPKSFIPERFDPESKYFFKPNSDNQPRHPKSFIPFGFGARNCMGQSLAKLEGKVVLSRILTTIDYEIDQDLLENEYVSYNIISHFKVYGKIKDKISR